MKRTGFKRKLPQSGAVAVSSLKRVKIASGQAAGSGNGISASRKRLNPVGKRGSEWLTARRWLKRHFRYAGITTCEAMLRGCYFDNALSFAHCKKRRKMLEGEIYHVALLCVPCHSVYEHLPHEEMHVKIHEIIERRGIIAPQQKGEKL